MEKYVYNQQYRAGAGRKYNAAVCAMSEAAEDARVNIYKVFRTVSST